MRVPIIVGPAADASIHRPDPEIVTLVENALRIPHRDFQAGSTGVVIHNAPEELFRRNDHGTIYFSAALLLNVCDALERHGHEPVILDVQADSKPHRPINVDMVALQACADDDVRLVHAITVNNRGQVELRSQEDMIAKIATMVRLLPQALIAIGVATKQHADHLRRELRAALHTPVGRPANGLKNGSRRVCVGHYYPLTTHIHLNAGPRWDVLLLPVTREGLPRRAIECVENSRPTRVFALVPPQQGRRRQHYLLHAVAGPVIYGGRMATRPIKIAMLRTPPVRIRLPRKTEALGTKQRLYWQNRPRNRFIAHVAKAITERHGGALRRLGLVAEKFAVLARSDAKVAVLVESPAHGRLLQELLPGWELLTYPAQSPPEQYSGSRSIVTVAYAAHYGLPADVVVRATGTASPLERDIGRFPEASNEAGPAEVLIVDFDDGFCPVAQRMSELREKDYARAGIYEFYR